MVKELRDTAPNGRAMSAARFSVKTAMVSVFGCGLALCLTGSAAQAQYVEESARKSYAIRVGTYIPTEQDARRIGGTHNLAIEADYTLQRLPERSSIGIASIGFIERNQFRIVPMTIGQIFRDPGYTVSGKSYYYGFGTGFYWTRMNFPGSDDRIKPLWGGYVVVGLDLNSTVFVEGKYNYISKYNTKFVGGTQLSIGARF